MFDYSRARRDDLAAVIEFIEALNVKDEHRIGTDLVRTGLHWMFAFESVSETWLVVDEDNAGARSLYDRLGWTEVHRLTSIRRSGRPER